MKIDGSVGLTITCTRLEEVVALVESLAVERGGPPVVYVAHPVSGDVEANLTNATMWMAMLLRTYPHVAWVAPWILDAQVLDDADPEQREAGLVRDQAVVRRADALLLVGGRLSAGMAREVEAAHTGHVIVVDATALGYEVPHVRQEQVGHG